MLLPGLKRAQPQSMFCAAVMAAMIGLSGQLALAQGDTPPPQGTSRGENFSAKPAPALFNSDCTGGGCHKGPQGLGKNQSQGGLTSFLREHYTNSRQSASALADYLLRSPGAPAPTPAATEARTPRTHPNAQSSRAAARPDETPASTPPAATTPAPAAGPAAARRTAEPSEKPVPPGRTQRGRHTAATPTAAPSPEAAPPAPPPPKQYDIFD